MAQITYIHVSKCKNDKIKFKNKYKYDQSQKNKRVHSEKKKDHCSDVAEIPLIISCRGRKV
jgi:hypothetical protein